MKYYYLHDDIFSPNVVQGRWHLSEFKYIENWKFLRPTAEIMEPRTWLVDVYQDGVETDFSLNGPSGSPIVSERLRNALLDLPEFQIPYKRTVIEPVSIDNKKTSENYYVMITQDRFYCVDEERSDFQKFTENDSVRPDLAGKYRAFFNLIIDPKKVGKSNIFRVEGAESILIVTEEFKKRYDEIGATGAVFDSVMGDRKTIA
jgi:hypothetical protein